MRYDDKEVLLPTIVYRFRVVVYLNLNLVTEFVSLQLVEGAND